MNIEICKECNRKLIFTDDHEKMCWGERQRFFCCNKLNKNDFEFKYLNISSYLLSKSKWKLINFNFFRNIILFDFNRKKYINKIFKKYKAKDLSYDDINFTCPYCVEHQMSEWNNKK